MTHQNLTTRLFAEHKADHQQHPRLPESTDSHATSPEQNHKT